MNQASERLRQVVEELFLLPEADQEKFADLIVELKLELLRDDVRAGLASGSSNPLDVQEIIHRGRERLAARKRTA